MGDAQKLYADPNSIEHEQAPMGDEYAVVDTSSKKRTTKAPDIQALYQVFTSLHSVIIDYIFYC